MRNWITAAVVFAGAYLVWIVLAGALSGLILLFTGILLAAGLQPLIRRLSARMPFGAAVGASFGLVIAVVAVVSWVLLAPLGAESVRLVAAVPGYLTSLQDRLVALESVIRNDAIATQIAGMLSSSAGAAVTAVGMHLLGGPALIAGLIGNSVLIVLLAVGWALSADELRAFVLSLCGPAARKDWEKAFLLMGARLSAYVQGIVLNGTVVGVAMGIGLAFAGTPYALLLAFVVAILQAIPMVGAVLSGLIVLLVVLAASGWTKMLVVLGIFAVIQLVDQNVLSPMIFGNRVQLSFLLIIFSTVAGGMLLGIAGAFLAVPAAAMVQIIIVEIVAPLLRSDTPGVQDS